MLALALAVALENAAVTLSYGDGDARTVDVYATDDGKKDKPVVVFFHGGVWQHGDRRDNDAFGNELARRGLVVVVANYRLTRGDANRWPAQVEDAAAVVDLALKEAARFGGDPKKLVVTGHSAGAQMAAMLAYDPRFLAEHHRSPGDIRALALLSCVCDLRAPLDEGQRDGGFASFVAPTFGSDRTVLEAASPIRALKKLAVPFLVVTSERDYRAMRAQTVAMDKALRALGEDVTFVDVPAVDHFGIVPAAATLDAIAALAKRITPSR